MLKISDTLPIVFNGGSYGTYLEWILSTLTTDAEIIAPFTSVGNSHKFRGNHIGTMNGWHNYIKKQTPHQFVRFHPKTSKEESLSANLDSILQTVNNVIYLYPDHNTSLLVINNYFTKVWDDWWTHQFNHDIDIDQIYNNWPVDRGVPVNDIPVWIKREFLSLYLVPAWHDQVEWYHPDHWQHPRCLTIKISDLLFNFVACIEKIKKFCNLTYTKDIVALIPYHQAMVSQQKHLNQDFVCTQIIDHTIKGENFDWDPLPLASESWIQWQLRNSKYEIRCDGLDKFPTNSLQLRNLLYPI